MVPGEAPRGPSDRDDLGDLEAAVRSADGEGAPLRLDYRGRLDAVDDALTGAALVVAEAMPRTVRALLAGDRGSVDEAREVARGVQATCRRVEDDGFLLLAREAPVSGELRRLVSLLRLVHHVDRAATIVRHVAGTTGALEPGTLPDDVRARLAALAARATEVFRGGVDAWRTRDALAVHELEAADLEVDRLRTELLLVAREVAAEPERVMLLGLLARYLERLGDHGLAFAQHTTFAVTGERAGVATDRP